jgi:hypothetical protein
MSEVAEIGFLQIGRVMREGGIEPVDQIAGGNQPLGVARAALFEQGVGLGQIGRTRQIIGQEAAHPVDAQRLLLDAGKNLARNSRQVTDALGDLLRADGADGDFEADRQRLGIGQSSRANSICARAAPLASNPEQSARREQHHQSAAGRGADEAGDPERHADADHEQR